MARPTKVPQWSFQHQVARIERGSGVRIMVEAPARCRYTCDDWQTIHDVKMRREGEGLFVTRISAERLAGAAHLEFTFHWLDSGSWEGRNFSVELREGAGPDGP